MPSDPNLKALSRRKVDFWYFFLRCDCFKIGLLSHYKTRKKNEMLQAKCFKVFRAHLDDLYGLRGRKKKKKKRKLSEKNRKMLEKIGRGRMRESVFAININNACQVPLFSMFLCFLNIKKIRRKKQFLA